MPNTKMQKSFKLVESALLVAVAIVLSILPLAEMPYGGSVTIASLFPLVLIAYRHGILWGIGSGFVYGIIQQLLGLKNLTYVTGWQSVLAVIFLDYLVAFAVIGFSGAFRNVFEKQRYALAAGAGLGCLLRYICHVVSGATVWAGLSIPTQAALGYSLIYNATYMIPETLVLVVVAFYLGSVLDFQGERPVRLSNTTDSVTGDLPLLLASILTIGALVYDVATLFAHLQDSETGYFSGQGLKLTAVAGQTAWQTFSQSFWFRMILVTGIALISVVILMIVRRINLKKEEGKEKTEE